MTNKAMKLPAVVQISELRYRQQAVLDDLARVPALLTHRGKPVAVLVSVDDWQAIAQNIDDMDIVIDVLKDDLARARGEGEELIEMTADEMEAWLNEQKTVSIIEE